MPNAPSSKGCGAEGERGARVVVVGCGFIGSHVVAELASRARAPAVLTRSRPPAEIAALIGPEDLHIGDAAHGADLEPLLAQAGEVIYSAGGLLPAQSQVDPERDAELTLKPLRTVLGVLARRPGARLTYVSSGGTVYGDPEEIPVSETAPLRPTGSYGALHLTCEEEILRAMRDEGLRARIVRCSTVYGEHQLPERGQGAVVTFLHRIENGLPIDLYGGGSTIRDYVYAGDVARLIVGLLGCPDEPVVVNVGSEEGTSLLELLGLVEQELGRSAEVRAHPERSFDVHRIVLDTTRLRSLLDYQPTPLAIGIARTHTWLGSARTEKDPTRPALRAL